MWELFSNSKPKNDKWYLCTVEIEGQQRYVMGLYWYSNEQKFIDNIRKNVCETYIVTSNITGERLRDIGQDRTNSVIAWTEYPEPYMTGFKTT